MKKHLCGTEQNAAEEQERKELTCPFMISKLLDQMFLKTLRSS